MNPEIIGLAAGALTSFNLLPQIKHSWATKSVEDLSITAYLVYDLGLALWVVYGLAVNSWSIVIMDGFALLTSLLMTYLKLRY